MSSTTPAGPPTVQARAQALVVRERDAEEVALPSGGVFRLLADAGATGQVLGANRLTLPAGVDGAKPHRHLRSTETFYVLDGELELLLGEQLTTAAPGDLVVVPPGLPHAFGARAGTAADLLAVITPGVERFGYFRHLQRIALGEDTWDTLRPLQELYDVHFLDSARWQDARG
jgi:quercetin dioxygenase-like cupin family protein